MEWLLPHLLERYEISVYRLVQELEGKVGRSTLYKWSQPSGPVTIDPLVLGWVIWALRRLTGENIVEADIVRTGIPVTERIRSTMAHIIALANQKGGVAKTTTAIHLAAGLALRGHRVLAIDVDPQYNLTAGLGVIVDQAKGSITNVLKLEDGTVEVAIHQTDIKRLDVVPADILLASLELELVSRFPRETVLRDAITSAVREAYDFVVLDSPPNLGMLTMNVLTAANTVIVPVGGEFYSLQGMEALMKQVEVVQRKLNSGLTNARVLLTRMKPTNISNEVGSVVRQLSADGKFPQVFSTEIKELTHLAESAAQGQPVYAHAPKSQASELYFQFTDEFLAHVGQV